MTFKLLKFFRNRSAKFVSKTCFYEFINHQKIYELRGQKVMLDFDLAELYEVSTSALNQAVKRNFKRFPDDFMFQLTREEYAA